MKSSKIVVILLNCHNKELLDRCGKEFAGVAKNKGFYMRQYLLKNMPVGIIVKNAKEKVPGLQLLVLGNTNPKFQSLEQYDALTKRLDKYARCTGCINIAALERIEDDPKEFESKLKRMMEKEKMNTMLALSGIYLVPESQIEFITEKPKTKAK